jgi:hypothetical protein
MGGTCSKHGDEKSMQSFSWKMCLGRDKLGHRCRWEDNFEMELKLVCGDVERIYWVRKGPVVGLCEHDNEFSRLQKRQ